MKYPASFSATNNLTPDLDRSTSTISLIDVKKSKPPKCYLDSEIDVVTWILGALNATDRDNFQCVDQNSGKHHKPKHKSLDCSIMDVADDISYGVHDLEDAIALGLLKQGEFEQVVESVRCTSFLNALKAKYPHECGNNVYEHWIGMLFADSASRKRCISRLIHHFMTAIEVIELPEFTEPLLRYRVQVKAEQREFLDTLHEVVRDKVILDPSVQHLEFKGQKMVVSVFEAMASDPKRLLPRDAYKIFNGSESKHRVICDYVAGMTDGYLLKTYERLFSPRMGSVFDKL